MNMCIPFYPVDEAELRALYDEVHDAYLEALEAHRRAVALENRLREALLELRRINDDTSNTQK